MQQPSNALFNHDTGKPLSGVIPSASTVLQYKQQQNNIVVNGDQSVYSSQPSNEYSHYKPVGLSSNDQTRTNSAPVNTNPSFANVPLNGLYHEQSNALTRTVTSSYSHNTENMVRPTSSSELQTPVHHETKPTQHVSLDQNNGTYLNSSKPPTSNGTSLEPNTGTLSNVNFMKQPEITPSTAQPPIGSNLVKPQTSVGSSGQPPIKTFQPPSNGFVKSSGGVPVQSGPSDLSKTSTSIGSAQSVVSQPSAFSTGYAPATSSSNVNQTPNMTSTFQPPTMTSTFQPPTMTSTFQAPTMTSTFQAPTMTSTFQAPTMTSTFQPPTMTSTFQPPTMTSTFQPPTMTSTFQAPTMTSTFQPPTMTSTFQPPTMTSTFQPSNMTSTFQAPTMTSTFQPPTMTSKFQPPTMTSTFQPPSMTSTFQPPTMTSTFQPPTAGGRLVQPQTTNSVPQPTGVPSNSFRPPSSGTFVPPSVQNNNSFQPPVSTPSMYSRPPTQQSKGYAAPTASNPMQPPINSQPQPLSANKIRPSYPTKSAYQAASSAPPYPTNTQQPFQNKSNVGMNSGPNQPSYNPNIPPLPPSNNNQQNSQNYQPSNNYQVPPQPQGTYSAYPSNNYAPQQAQPGFQQTLNSQFSNMSVNQGINRVWGYEPHDLLNTRNVLPSTKVEPPPVRLPQDLPESMNCSRDLFRCTLTKIPETKSLLDKSRLPLGLLIHPFKDINNLKVIKNMIVRCKNCRTYINPFVTFLDSKLWKCNICFRTNEIHEQFLYDRNTDMYGDPYRRPEIQSATVEYLATADYNVRDPPQPAMYLFLLDVSQIAAQSKYLYTVCEVLLNQLKSLPGDRRTSVGIITYDSAVHFYSLAEGQTQPSQLILTDIEDIFIPSPENILVNLNECYDMIVDLLKQLPDKFKDTLDSGSALGAALQSAFKLLRPTGGRITIFQTCLPNKGPGALQPRENPNQRSNDEPPHMNPATDFYKKLALDCSSVHIAVDLFILNSQYVDLASLSGVSKFSSGCIHHIPLYSGKNMSHVYQLDRMFSRYLTRKIGFESVMRVRCTRGMSIHTFHGNFFVRSPDLLALPNVNPDAGFGIQISIDENLTHVQHACFQAAVLYTSSKGDRRIRVHTVCLPVVNNISDVLVGADQQCIVGLLAKMAVDRSLQHSLTDAREAYLNVVCDVLSTYKMTQSSHMTGSLLAPSSLKLLPLYVLALLKHPAFRVGQSTRLDDRLFAMCEMKTMPLNSLLLSIYPELYPIHTLDQDATFEWNDLEVPSPQILQLSAERLQAPGVYLLNTSDTIIILVRHATPAHVCSGLFGFQSVSQMPETLFELPQLETSLSIKLNAFIGYLNDDKAYVSPVKVIKDSSPDRLEFYDRLIEDKNASGMSYYEFLQRVREQIK